jgi:hypothetical protein
MKIELVIDELVLHGFDPRQRHAIGDAVASELTRLAHAHGVELGRRPAMDLARFDAGAFEARSQTPAGTGSGIANRVFTALRGTSS